MLVLALDTSSAAVSAGLSRVTPTAVEPVAESVAVDGRRHGELLAVGVRVVLAEAGVDRRELTAVVVGTGPGPFTGLRVGLVTAATTADALGIPAYGVCSLDAFGLADGWVLADARRKEVYWARYAAGERVEGPGVCAPADLPLPCGAVLAGAGALLHRASLPGLVRDEPRYPSAHLLVVRAADRVRAGAPSEPLTPLYLRRPDAVEPGASKRVTA
ncbi:MAG: tRNA (adenosine(37)-N6)-threonylcarbamoyltransferase complex dimerization subunit type 1 TsaB [Frankiaceae bacterium]|nr:tRNA (adenosine(37)-N6)-threonylcarbamoyltransferase complex dimerization subunit type 1 TsaB [Frankiaceae bacterium]